MIFKVITIDKVATAKERRLSHRSFASLKTTILTTYHYQYCD